MSVGATYVHAPFLLSVVSVDML